MVNNSEFTIRLKKVMEFYNLTASNFADRINVQRSSISHILSGRNKPSLDFVLKITNSFNDVDINWLLKGIGSFPKKEKETKEQIAPPPSLFDTTTVKKNETSNNTTASKDDTSIREDNNTKKKEIEKIVIFYSDGTFKEYRKE